MRNVLAWSVHLFTASGAVLALLALRAIDQHRWTDAMLWLLVALVVDGVDGSFARAARTRELVPRISGDVLDLVIDYLNYVFIPTVFLLEAQLLPPPFEWPLAALIQLSSLYVFARRDMKTEDGYFRGFPALWNVVALYLFAANLGPTAAAIVIAALVLLTFAPIHVAHPFRARGYGRWPAVLATLWAAATVALLLPWITGSLRTEFVWASSAAALLLILAGLRRTWTGQGSAAETSAPEAPDRHPAPPVTPP